MDVLGQVETFFSPQPKKDESTEDEMAVTADETLPHAHILLTPESEKNEKKSDHVTDVVEKARLETNSLVIDKPGPPPGSLEGGSNHAVEISPCAADKDFANSSQGLLHISVESKPEYVDSKNSSTGIMDGSECVLDSVESTEECEDPLQIHRPSYRIASDRQSIDVVGDPNLCFETSLISHHDHELGKCGYEDGHWVCQPYKKEIFEKRVRRLPPGKDRRDVILSTLRELGVKVYVIDGMKTKGTYEILKKVRLVSTVVAKENSIEPWTGPLGYLRCLLFEHSQGRLFNLIFPEHTVGPLGKWQEYLETFSCTQAIVALLILCRSFSCATEGERIPIQFTISSVFMRAIN